MKLKDIKRHLGRGYSKPKFKGDIDLTHHETIKSFRNIDMPQQRLFGSLYAGDTDLETLYGCPQWIEGNCDFEKTAITSLQHGPKFIGGYFSIDETEVSSFEGAPEHIGRDFYFFNTKITSLHGIQNHIKYIGGSIGFNPTVTNLLGLFFIKGLTKVMIDMGPIQKAFVKHLPTGDVHACQEELIEAGYSMQAKF